MYGFDYIFLKYDCVAITDFKFYNGRITYKIIPDITFKKFKYTSLIDTDNNLYRHSMYHETRKITNIKTKKILFHNMMVSVDGTYYKMDIDTYNKCSFIFESKLVSRMCNNYLFENGKFFNGSNIITSNVQCYSSCDYKYIWYIDDTDHMLHRYALDKKYYANHIYTDFLLSDDCYIPNNECSFCYVFDNTRHKFYYINDECICEGNYSNDIINIIDAVFSGYSVVDSAEYCKYYGLSDGGDIYEFNENKYTLIHLNTKFKSIHKLCVEDEIDDDIDENNFTRWIFGIDIDDDLVYIHGPFEYSGDKTITDSVCTKISKCNTKSARKI